MLDYANIYVSEIQKNGGVMPHFFISTSNIENSVITINDNENYRHIARALRARVGEELLIIDEKQIQYETKITEITSKDIKCKIEKSYPSKRDLKFDLYLAQSPLRSDAQLTVMEKSTELGVRGVYPVITDNCSLSFETAQKKQEKWQKVMFEASKQCERAKIPTCYEPLVLSELFKQKFDRIIVFGERSTEINLKTYLNNNPIKNNEKMLVIIGPEGGFSQKEFELFKKLNFPIITLGDLILKAETAVIVALGDIIYEYQG